MKNFIQIGVAALLSAFLALPSAAQTLVSGYRIGEHGTGTRFVLDASAAAAHEVFVLADPYRVVVDLPDTTWTLDAAAGTKGRGLIAGFRFGPFRPGVSRLVLDLAGPALVKAAFWLSPRDGKGWRFVIDLAPAERAAFLAAVRKPEAPPEARVPAAPVPRPADPRRTVVLDPGHGGVDPGAIGASGTQEKEVTLGLARLAAARLSATGRYRVVLTRDDDAFRSLAERVRAARRENADLFVSIHADSIHDPKIRGATVYTLSEKASDREAEALAAKENRADVIAGVDLAVHSDEVGAILIDLAQREALNQSTRFARFLVGEFLERRLPARNTHRSAGFRVLTAPDVPSVLFETGYLTNRADEAALASPAGQRRIADALAAAIERYFAAEAGQPSAGAR